MRRRLVGGVAGLAVLAGAGGAYAVSQASGGDERDAFKNDVAKRLNVTPDELDKALEGAANDRLDAAVAAGRLTKAQADEIKQRMKEHGGPPLFFGGPPPGGPHGGPHGGGMDAAAKYLDLTPEQLHTQLESGKSLAQVAKAKGKSVEGLKSAIGAAIRDDLDKAVADKRLTEKQKQQILAGLDKRIADLVDRKPGDRPGPRGRRFRGGPPPPGFGPPPPGGPHKGPGPGGFHIP
jgi:hypothetical protein